MLAARHRARLAMGDKKPDPDQEAKLRSVRRRLNFGDTNDDNLPSKDELERKFAEERARHQEEKKKEWNFDFSKGIPLEGQWKWEKVGESSGGSTAAPEKTDSNALNENRDAEDQAS